MQIPGSSPSRSDVDFASYLLRERGSRFRPAGIQLILVLRPHSRPSSFDLVLEDPTHGRVGTVHQIEQCVTRSDRHEALGASQRSDFNRHSSQLDRDDRHGK